MAGNAAGQLRRPLPKTGVLEGEGDALGLEPGGQPVAHQREQRARIRTLLIDRALRQPGFQTPELGFVQAGGTPSGNQRRVAALAIEQLLGGALEAKMVVRSSKGERVIDAENFFVLPGADITRMTVLEPGDILTAIRLPAKWAGAKFYFEKVADRNTWDFALVNIAAVKLMDGDTVKDVRIAAGGVQNSPKRLKVVEDTVKGQKITPELAQLAGNAATRGARPLNYNHFKVPLLANLVSRALRAA